MALNLMGFNDVGSTCRNCSGYQSHHTWIPRMPFAHHIDVYTRCMSGTGECIAYMSLPALESRGCEQRQENRTVRTGARASHFGKHEKGLDWSGNPSSLHN